MKIYPIQTGTVQIKTRQREGKGRGLARKLNMMFDSEWTEPLPIFAWVIDHDEGIIVVDTGDTARTSEPGYFPLWHPYYRLGVRIDILPEQEIGPQLRKLGISPSDVKILILTHFHTDHAGGLHHFPDSKILANERDYKSAKGFLGKLQGYLPHRWPKWFRPTPVSFESNSAGSFEKNFRVTERGDVIIVPTPGHTPGHMSVVAEENGVYYFLAGDTTYTEQILLDEQVDGVSPDESIALMTIRKILDFARTRPTVYLPTHDPDSLRRLRENRILAAEDLQTAMAG